LDGYAKSVPGTYIREYKGKKFPVRINQLGLRGNEVRIDKEEDVFRIVMLGGSSVMGLESPEDATITSVLENFINKDKDSLLALIGKQKAEVINSGIIAHTTGIIAEMLEKEILGLNPDLILIYSAFNDYRHAGVFDAAGSFQNNALRRILGKAWLWLYNHSLLFLTMYEKFTIFPEKSISLKLAESTFKSYKENIEKIIHTSEKRGIACALVKQPLRIEHFPPLQREPMITEIQHKVEQGEKITYEQAYYWMQSRELSILDGLSKRYDVILIDPLEGMYEQDKREPLFHDIVHLNEKGNAFLAEIIFEKLKKTYGNPEVPLT
jgi:lysophospholipase L1-like esterase